MHQYRTQFFALTMAVAAATATAQTANYTHLTGAASVGCSPVGIPVDHQAIGLPILGSTFGLRSASSNGMCFYLCNMQMLVIGTSDTSYGSLALPALPQQLGLPGCGQLRVSPDVHLWMPVLSVSQPQTTTFALPLAPALAGQQFFVQSIAATWIGGGLNAVAFGQAGQGTIGF